jgi:hypothetical protein
MKKTLSLLMTLFIFSTSFSQRTQLYRNAASCKFYNYFGDSTQYMKRVVTIVFKTGKMEMGDLDDIQSIDFGDNVIVTLKEPFNFSQINYDYSPPQLIFVSKNAIRNNGEKITVVITVDDANQSVIINANGTKGESFATIIHLKTGMGNTYVPKGFH